MYGTTPHDLASNYFLWAEYLEKLFELNKITDSGNVGSDINAK